MNRTPIVVLAALGLALSLALELLHVRAYLQPSASSFCAVGERLDCTSVALSRYSVLLGVPVPLWGALGFVAILVAAVRRSRWLLPLTGAAAVASLVLLRDRARGDRRAVFALRSGSSRVLRARCACVARAHAAVVESTEIANDAARSLRAVRRAASSRSCCSCRAIGSFSAGRATCPLPTERRRRVTRGLEPRTRRSSSRSSPITIAHTVRQRVARSRQRLREHPKTLRLVRRQFPRMRCPKRPGIRLPGRAHGLLRRGTGKVLAERIAGFSSTRPSPPSSRSGRRSARDVGLDLESSPRAPRATRRARVAESKELRKEESISRERPITSSSSKRRKEGLAKLLEGLQ